MALSKDNLQENLEAWLSDLSYETIHDSMVVFINAYDNYASDAMDISGDSPLLLNKQDALDILDTITTAETAASVALKFENAIIAFWAGATFKIIIPPAGTVAPEVSAIVTTNIVPGTLVSTLTPIFSDLSPKTYAQKAAELATAFDDATLTIIVTCIGTIPPPTGGVLAVLGPII